MTVEAGLTLAEAQAAADEVNRLFPLSLPSEGSCQIGGNIAINAGGTSVLAYGNARQLVLGLEVVLADGRVWDGLKGLKKDNSGYDLKDLFIGSEGTLGIITAAVLKLFPRPAEKATAFVALPDLDVGAGAVQPGAGDGRPRPHRLRGHGRHRARSRSEAHSRHARPVRRPPSLVRADGDLGARGRRSGRARADRGAQRCQRARAHRRRGDRRLAGAGARFLAPARVLFAGAEARGRQHQERHLRGRGPHPRVHRPRRRRGCAPVPGRAARAAGAFRRRQRALQHRPADGHGEGGSSWRGGTTSRTPCRTSSSSSAARSRPSTASA